MEVPTIRTHVRWLATQPRFEYLLLEERRGGTGDLPENNLVTELVKQGIEQGIVRAIEQQWRLLHRLVERKFGVEAARKLAEASARQSHLEEIR